ncbi:Spermine synthase [Operophtera brumata]|uniref:Spermine synthase n=1 Tax=Operophtera brumata TaxID=104452 RepID=A0A0L7KVB4_OPEBR|nr:Spermine synthase [Operophtera brumata]
MELQENGTIELLSLLSNGTIELLSLLSNGTIELLSLLSNGTIELLSLLSNGTIELQSFLSNGTIELLSLLSNGTIELLSLLSNGGGDGALLYELLKEKPKFVWMLEIDSMELGKLEPAVQFSKCQAFVPSFLEEWIFYQIAFQQGGAGDA